MPPSLPLWARLLVAPACVALSAAVQKLVLPQPSLAPFAFLIFGVALASWLAGRLAGLISVAVAALVGDYIFMPAYQSAVLGDQALRELGLFSASSIAVAILAGSLRASEARLRERALDLRQKEQRLRVLFEKVALGIAEADLETRIENANQRFCDILGYRKDQLIGVSIHDLTAPEDRARSDEINAKVARGELDSSDYEKRYLKKDGTPIWVHVTVSGVRAPSGAMQRMVGTVEDITERKNADARIQDLNTTLERRNAELDAERTRWRGVVEGIADEMWVCDAQGKMSLVNLPDATAMGLPEFEGKSVEEVLEDVEITYPDGRPRPASEAPLLRSLCSGEIVRGEEIMRSRKTGRVRHRQFSCAPMRDAAGRVTGAVAIVHDVSQAKQTEQALRETDRRKSEFLAVLSHELRNPLAPIRYSIHILEQAKPGGDQAKRAQEVIDRQVRHMARLIDDLLDITRISRGKIRLKRERVELCPLIHGAAEDYRGLFAANGVELKVAGCDAPLFAEGDPTRLSQILGNLLQNAAKFTPRGGHVGLSLKAEDSQAVIRVRDDGAGIPPEMREKLFEPFMQADHTLDRSKGGLGLGLALVKGLVELHGGSISAQSQGPEGGAEFIVRLPLQVAHAPRSHVAPLQQDPAPSARRVLVIEDSPDSAESLKEALELNGHEVAVAGTGPDGVSLAHIFQPDVVVCDIGLPGFDGYEVARRLRADPTMASVPLVALSGYSQPEDVDRSREAGFARHLAKPPDLSALERALVVADVSTESGPA